MQALTAGLIFMVWVVAAALLAIFLGAIMGCGRDDAPLLTRWDRAEERETHVAPVIPLRPAHQERHAQARLRAISGDVTAAPQRCPVQHEHPPTAS